MCIVCEIRNKLGSEVASAETIGFVMERVELMAQVCHNVTELGKEYAETGPGINKAVFLETASFASCLLSDDESAIKRRTDRIVENRERDQHPAERFFDLLASLLAVKRREDAKANQDDNPGLPPEVWATMPAELRNMLKGAKVIHMEGTDEALQKLFAAISPDDYTKH